MWSEKIILFLGCILQSHSVLSLWTCTQDADCASTVGALCWAGDCVCPPGQQAIRGGTICVDVASYFTSPCFEDHQCSHLITNYECRVSEESEEGSCFCQAGFHYFLGRCWPSVDFGGSCNRNEECMGILKDPFNLVCEQGTCSCAEGYYQRQRGECRKIGYAVGDGCILNEDCQFADGVCDLESFRCVDSNGNSTNDNTTFVDTVKNNVPSRVLTREHGIACDSETNCTEPFICSAFGACVCPIGYYASENGSICYAQLGSPSTEEQCVGFLAEVVDGVCACPSNVYYEENMKDCIKATRLRTDSCVSDDMCLTFGTAARCSDPQPPWGLRNCECVPELAVWDEARSMCRLYVGIGENCQASSDCLAGDMEIECVIHSEGQGVCTCPAGYAPLDGLCLTTGLQLGDSCQASPECTVTPNTVCTNGTCSCGEGYQEEDGMCAPTIGGSCLVDSDCVIDNSVCVAHNSSSTCQCADNFVEYGDLCWPELLNTTSECNVTAQCVALMGDASVCVDSQCDCIANYHSRDGRCWPQIGLFETCSRTSECYLNEISERLVCRNSMCQCAFDFAYSEELQTCSSSASTLASSVFAIFVTLIYVMSN